MAMAMSMAMAMAMAIAMAMAMAMAMPMAMAMATHMQFAIRSPNVQPSPWHHEPRKSLSPQKRAKLFAEKEGRCHSCTRKIRPGEGWIVEHVVALENGGTNDWSNLDITCGWCKGEKDAQDHRIAAKSRRVTTKHVVPKAERGKRQGFRGWRKFNGEVIWK